MNARFQNVWRSRFNQNVAFGSYCAVGFLAGLTAGAWALPASILQPLLAWARQLGALAALSWDPPAVASYFGLMLLLGLVWLIPMGIAFASRALPRPPERVIFFGLPLAAGLAAIAYGFVVGWGDVDVPPEATRSKLMIAMMVGSRFGVGIFATIWMATAMGLASISVTAVIVLARGLRRRVVPAAADR